MSMRMRFPCRTLPWNDTKLLFKRHQERPEGKRDIEREKRKWPFRDRFSSAVGVGPGPSSMSLLADAKCGLRVPPRPAAGPPALGVPEKRLMNMSSPHTSILSTIVAAMMARNSDMEMPKRSCGRSPTE